MSRPVIIPGARDVRGSLDESARASQDGGSADVRDRDAVVVACPPDPRGGGNRSDERLRAVSDGLTGRGVDCLRFDYGPWDGGCGERADARNAVRWAVNEYDHVGVFGYSFGGAVAILVASDSGDEVDVTSVLAPPAWLGDNLDVVAALETVAGPLQVLYAADDTTVEWRPVIERARELGHNVRELSGNHFFVRARNEVAEASVSFLADKLM